MGEWWEYRKSISYVVVTLLIIGLYFTDEGRRITVNTLGDQTDDSRAPGPAKSKHLSGLYEHMLNTLGQQICARELPSGSVVTLDDIEREHGVSRSVVRESVRVLESMGLVRSRRRVGVIVQPQSRWNLFDPQVIRWRLASADREIQLRSLTELRMAAEPAAARLAAQRISLERASHLVALSARLWAAGKAGDLERFLEIDLAFHNLILENCGNEMFAHMRTVIDEVLVGRTQYGLMPARPHIEALQLHADVANAIQHGDADAAGAAMRRILERIDEELTEAWSAPQDSPVAPTHEPSAT